MVTQENENLLHWSYFLALESDVERLARFVEFTVDNFGAYSIEMARILLASCSEIDVVAKMLCKSIDPSTEASKIDQYRSVIHSAIPAMTERVVFLPRHGLKLTPWESWGDDATPDWWSDHQMVKHERDQHFHRAHLENVLNAVSGLFVIVAHYYTRSLTMPILEPGPSLFAPDVGTGSVEHGALHVRAR